MPKITISGHPGSGTSSLVEKLMEHYNWGSVNGGQIFRDEAKARNLSLAEFGKLCNDDESTDRELDEKELADKEKSEEPKMRGEFVYTESTKYRTKGVPQTQASTWGMKQFTVKEDKKKP